MAGAIVLGCAIAAGCTGGGGDATPTTTTDAADDGSATPSVPADVVTVVDGGLDDSWSDYGWSATIGTDSVEVDFGGWGGWIAAQPGLTGSFGELVIELDATTVPDGDFLRVQLSDDLGSSFPSVVPEIAIEGPTARVSILMGELLQGISLFDRIVVSAAKEMPEPTLVRITSMYLVPGDPRAGLEIGSDDATASVDCAADPLPISPHIYGFSGGLSGDPTAWDLRPPSRRWGGNPTSRYNPTLGTWNTGIDYYWENVALAGDPPAHERFLRDNWEHGALSAVTVPMLGWVAKDAESNSFSVEQFGPQEETDPFRPDAGNGVGLDGEELPAPDPSTTSVPFGADDVAAWIDSMNDLAAETGGAEPMMYFLDNEPMLWDTTHRDVFPDLLGYDELLARTIDVASAVRESAPDALIAGPSVWGWPAYFYSAIDDAAGFDQAPDRRAHGGQPLIEWYLDQLREYEERTGVRLLDVLDVHFYPQDGSYGPATDERASSRRLRSTRSLWDPGYGEESWIEEPVKLIPRMADWVDEHYPGTKLSIGEYSFGAARHMSGGLAQAEALGRFGQNGLFAAYYWYQPEVDTPVYWAFRAFRDYDGAGSQFGELSLPTDADRPVSLFASESADGDRNVLVVLNLSADEELTTSISVAGCDRTSATGYQYVGSVAGLEPVDVTFNDDLIDLTLPPWSISVVELT